MATGSDIDFTYTLTDRLFRMSVGELADFSGAKYDGDFTLTLEQAQRRKHEYVATHLQVRPGGRILDLGCGWGAMLAYFRSLGIRGVGVTLSHGQQQADIRHGLDVRLMDAGQLPRKPLAPSMGSSASAPSSTSAPSRSGRPAGRMPSTLRSSRASQP
jgi:cyclopropane-fatty-acyl-phospholipid synthase